MQQGRNDYRERLGRTEASSQVPAQGEKDSWYRAENTEQGHSTKDVRTRDITASEEREQNNMPPAENQRRFHGVWKPRPNRRT